MTGQDRIEISTFYITLLSIIINSLACSQRRVNTFPFAMRCKKSFPPPLSSHNCGPSSFISVSPCHRLKMVQADYSGRPECTLPCSPADESLGLLSVVLGLRVNRIHSKMLMDIQGRI